MTLPKLVRIGGLKYNDVLSLKSVNMSELGRNPMHAIGRCLYVKFVKVMHRQQARRPSHDDGYDLSEDFEFVLWDNRDPEVRINNARQYGMFLWRPSILGHIQAHVKPARR